MSTVLNTNGAELQIPIPANKETFRAAIVTAEWNPDITYALRDGALATFAEAGVNRDNILLFDVPGTVELVNATAAIVTRLTLDAVIVIGCVIRGDTPHFDYVCMQAAEGVAAINAEGGTPVIFGVLTVDNLSQAKDRAGGRLGNKGAEAAAAAISMSNLHHTLDNL